MVLLILGTAFRMVGFMLLPWPALRFFVSGEGRGRLFGRERVLGSKLSIFFALRW